jgi:hypothetical protein
MVQAAILDGQFLELFAPFNDGCVAPRKGGQTAIHLSE